MRISGPGMADSRTSPGNARSRLQAPSSSRVICCESVILGLFDFDDSDDEYIRYLDCKIIEPLPLLGTLPQQ
jgi:hypothetical protein